MRPRQARDELRTVRKNRTPDSCRTPPSIGGEPTQFITGDVTFVNRKVEEILLVNNN